MTSWKFAPLWLLAWYILWVGLVLGFAFAVPIAVAYAVFLLPVVVAVGWKLRHRGDDRSER